MGLEHKVDSIALSKDTDLILIKSIDSYATSPLGFTPYFVFKMLLFLFNSKKVISCDIAELNPIYDRDDLTANLAAKLGDFIVMNNSN